MTKMQETELNFNSKFFLLQISTLSHIIYAPLSYFLQTQLKKCLCGRLFFEGNVDIYC